jgi:peptidoglycan/LPS O-acetylase OafA/YrhL
VCVGWWLAPKKLDLPEMLEQTVADAQTARESRPQIPALTGMRFVAAFFVLFGHSTDWIAQFTGDGNQIKAYFLFPAVSGMTLFFVLSGFVIHYNYRDLFVRHGIARAICEFSVARFSRLYPLYFVFLVVALGADVIISSDLARYPERVRSILAYSLTLTQSWWYIVYEGKTIINWFFPLAWSISTEMFFYACYPALAYVAYRASRFSTTISAIVIFCAIVIFLLCASGYHYLQPFLAFAKPLIPDYIAPEADFSQSFDRWFFYFSPYVRVLEFTLGCLTAQLVMVVSARPVSKLERLFGAWLLAATIISVLVLGYMELDLVAVPLPYKQYIHHMGQNFLCAPSIAAILFCVARYDSWLARALSAPVIILLGEMSYSTYLVHSWTLRLFLQPAQELTAFWAAYAILRVTLGIALTLAVAYVTYHTIEAWGRTHLRSWLRAAIVSAFRHASVGPPPRHQLAFCVAAVVGLTAIAVGGQAMRSERVANRIYRILVGERSEIEVLSALYGMNCANHSPVEPATPFSSPDKTHRVKIACDGKVRCGLTVSVESLGDSANGCAKAFTSTYICTGKPDVLTAFIPAEANGQRVELTCQ